MIFVRETRIKDGQGMAASRVVEYRIVEYASADEVPQGAEIVNADDTCDWTAIK